MRSSVVILGVGIVVAAGCAISPQPRVETKLYKTFPRTTRIEKTCVIRVSGRETIEQQSQGRTFTLRPRETLEEALLAGLKETCVRTRVGLLDALDPGAEIGVAAEVEGASMRQGFDLMGTDEAWVSAHVALHGAGDQVIEAAMEGHMVQSASFSDVDSAIGLAFVDVVNEINQLIFDHRAELSAPPAGEAAPVGDSGR